MRWFEKYVGKEFKDKGRGPDQFDCWGLVAYVYKHEHPDKIILPDYLDVYNSTLDKSEIANKINSEKSEWNDIKENEAKEFDTILINMRGVPMHIGIVIKTGFMLHCADGINCCIERYDSMRWKNKVVGFYRYGTIS